METEARVVVIGAGAAGIGAATRLLELQPSLRLVVLEARDRIGGRAHTTTRYGGAIDLGAQWLHYCPNNPLYTWARDHPGVLGDKSQRGDSKIQVVNFGDGYCRAEELEALPGAKRQARQIWNQFESKLCEAAQLQGLGTAELQEDVSLGEFLWDTYTQKEAPLVDALMQRHINSLEEVEGGMVEDLSAHCYLANKARGWNEDIAVGYGGLLQQFAGAEGLGSAELHLQAQVLSVSHEESTVIVQWKEDGEIHQIDADYVICTVPLGVIQSLSFKPELPSAVTSRLSSFNSACFEKIVIEFDRSFGEQIWLAECMCSGRESQSFVRFLNVGGDSNVWLGYTAPQFARQMAEEEMSDESVLTVALEALGAIFPEQELVVTRFELTRWLSDPFSQGSYSSQNVGSSYYASIDEDEMACTLMMDGRLALAGDYLAGENIGCCHGAFMSGQHAASRVWKHLTQVLDQDKIKEEEPVAQSPPSHTDPPSM